MRTMRSSMVGVAAAAFLCACTAKAKERPVAGTVVAESGSVTAAAPAGAARPLAVGDGVAADDTIATAKDASVSIRFAHNGVIWSLRGGLARRADQSVAWSAPKAATSGELFSSVRDASHVSGGRESGHESGHSSEVLDAKSDAGPVAKAAPDVQPVAPGGDASASSLSALPPPAAPDQDRAAGAPGALGGAVARGSGGGGGAAHGMTADEMPAPKSVEKATVAASNVPVRKTEAAEAKAKKNARQSAENAKKNANDAGAAVEPPAMSVGEAAPAHALWSVLDPAGREAAAVTSALAAGAFDACRLPDAANVDLVVHVLADGTIDDVALTGGSQADTVFPCVDEALRAVRLPAGAAANATLHLALPPR